MAHDRASAEARFFYSIVSDAVVSLIDLFPTFMAIVGMQPQPELELDGCDILLVLHCKREAPRFANG